MVKRQKNMSSSKLWIGIDPDVDKSGVAFWSNGQLRLYNMKFFELMDAMADVQGTSIDIFVRLEAGWLNEKSNWHNEKSGVRVAAKIGKNTGANHQAGKLIEEMLQYLNIPYELVRPTQNKVKADYFMKLTKYLKRTNQEQRDAAMLVFGK